MTVAKKNENQFMVRFPDGMRERLKTIAAENGRSLNSEIVHRLQASLEVDAFRKVEKADLNTTTDELERLLVEFLGLIKQSRERTQ